MQLNEEQKSNYEINKMFNIAEKVAMEYICYYLNDTPKKIFKEDSPNIIVEELVLYPLEEYPDKGFLHFGLEIVPHDYISKVPAELLENAYVQDSISFLNHSVSEVLQAIMHSSLSEEGVQKALDASFHLELDRETLTFKPVYVYETRRHLEVLNFCKEDLQKFYNDQHDKGAWEALQENIKLDWQDHYNTIQAMIDDIYYDEEEADKKEAEVNARIQTADRIGIIFSFHEYD